MVGNILSAYQGAPNLAAAALQHAPAQGQGPVGLPVSLQGAAQGAAWHPMIPLNRPTAAPFTPVISGAGATNGTLHPATSGSQDFLSWLGDILDRPRRAIANEVHQGFNEISKAQAQGPSSYNLLGGLMNVLTAPARGIFSTNPDDQATTAKLIEQGTDAIGPMVDKNYQNVQDNVNPIVKGIGGFIGDVALDPVTYIPGPDIATIAGKLGITGGKALQDAMRAGLKAPEDITPALEAGAQHALPDRPAPTLSPEANSALSSAMQEKAPLTAPGAVANPTALLPSSLVKLSDRYPQASKLLTELGKQPKVVQQMAVDYTKPLAQGQWLKEIVAAKPEIELTKGFKLGHLVDDPGLATIPANSKAIGKLYTNYLEGFSKAAERGKYLSPTGKVGAMPKALPPAKTQAMVERFSKIMSTPDQAAHVETALGTGITRALKMTRTDAKFQEKVGSLHDLLNRTEMLDGVTDTAQLNPLQNALVKHLTAVNGHRSLDVPWLNNLRATGLTEPSRVGQVRILADQAAAGDQVAKDAYESMKAPELSAAEQNVVDTLPKAVTEHVFDRENPGDWKGYLNQNDQYFVNKALRAQALKDTESAAKAGVFKTAKAPEAFNRARALRDQVMEGLGVHDKLMARMGVPLYIGVDHDLVPLSMHQIIDAMNRANEHGTLMGLFNHSTLVPDTNIADAVNLAIKGGDEDALVGALLNNTTRSGNRIPNQLVDNKGKLLFGHFRPVGAQNALHEPRFPFHSGPEDVRPTAVPNANKTGYYAKYTPEQVARTVARTILGAKDELADVAAKNSVDYAHRLSVETSDLAMAERAKLQSVLAGVDAPAALTALANVDKDVAHLASAAHATQDSVSAATAIAEGTVEPDLKIAADAAQKLSDLNLSHMANWMDHAHFQGRIQVAQHADELYAANAEEIFKLQRAQLAAQGLIDAEPAIKTFDLSDQIYRQTASAVQRRMDPLGKAFAVRSGNPNVWDALSGFLVEARSRTEHFVNNLADFARKNPGTIGDRTLIDQAFNDWQRGIVDDPQTMKTVQQIEDIWGQNWRGKAALLSNPFFGREISLDAINNELFHVGLRPQEFTGADTFFDEAKALEVAQQKGIPVAQAAMEQINDWKVNDSLNFMDRLYHAAERVNSKAGVIDHFLGFFGRRGVLTLNENVAKANKFVELVDHGDSVLFPFMPRTFVHPALAAEFKQFDEFMRMSRSLDSPFGRWFARNMDPLLRAWKRSVTVLRPGHHPRNLIGDSTMTFYGEGPRKFARSSKDSWRMLRYGGHSYNNVDLSAGLQELGVREMPRGDQVLARLKDGPITMQEAYEQAHKGGLFPAFHGVEGLYQAEQTSKFQKAVDALTAGSGRAGRIVGSMSEARDHLTRGQHFLQILYKAEKKMPPGVKTRQELFDYAAMRVRKYHPDGSNLAPFEQKYMTRLVPFYTWFRGALPVILESLIAHPGRVQTFSKAGYAMAVSSGLNPDSIQNPFPIGSVYPSYLTDQMAGPQFKVGQHVVGLNPGIAEWDVMNTLASPVQGVASMINPLIRVPAELMAGSRWGTQAPIKNMPEYIDQQLPGLGYVQNITGYSPTGAVVNALAGKAPIQTQAVQKGNKTPFDQQLALFNYITGLQGTNYNRPDYLKNAAISQRTAPNSGVKNYG